MRCSTASSRGGVLAVERGGPSVPEQRLRREATAGPPGACRTSCRQDVRPAWHQPPHGQPRGGQAERELAGRKNSALTPRAELVCEWTHPLPPPLFFPRPRPAGECALSRLSYCLVAGRWPGSRSRAPCVFTYYYRYRCTGTGAGTGTTTFPRPELEPDACERNRCVAVCLVHPEAHQGSRGACVRARVRRRS